MTAARTSGDCIAFAGQQINTVPTVEGCRRRAIALQFRQPPPAAHGRDLTFPRRSSRLPRRSAQLPHSWFPSPARSAVGRCSTDARQPYARGRQRAIPLPAAALRPPHRALDPTRWSCDRLASGSLRLLAPGVTIYPERIFSRHTSERTAGFELLCNRTATRVVPAPSPAVRTLTRLKAFLAETSVSSITAGFLIRLGLNRAWTTSQGLLASPEQSDQARSSIV